MSEQQQRRRHFRLRFPYSECPQLITEGNRFRIVEISEGGARILFEGRPPSCFAHPVDVHISFQDGSEVESSAVFLRLDNNEMILQFTKHIPMHFIISEQRRLLKHYYKGT